MNPLDYCIQFESALDSTQKEFSDLVDYMYADIGTSFNYKTHSRSQTQEKKLKKHLTVFLLNLFIAQNRDSNLYLRITRTTSFYNPKSRYSKIKLNLSKDFTDHIFDALVSKGYMIEVKGKRKPKLQTRIRATPKLNKLFSKYKIEQSFINNNAETIVLKNKNKELKEYTDNKQSIRMRKNLIPINNALKNADLGMRLTKDEYNQFISKLEKRKKHIDIAPYDKNKPYFPVYSQRRLYRSFNVRTKFDRGGRFYGGFWIGMPKQYRKFITINGKPTIELDLSSLHPRIIYAKEGLTPPDDAYLLNPSAIGDKSIRKKVKLLFNMMLNNKCKRGAMTAFSNKVREVKESEGIDLSLTESEKVKYGKLGQICDQILRNNTGIKNWFYKNKSTHLQYLDSRLAEKVLMKLADRNIIALPIHDSFLVEYYHKDVLKHTIEQSFKDIFGFECKLDEKEHYMSKWDINIIRVGF